MVHPKSKKHRLPPLKSSREYEQKLKELEARIAELELECYNLRNSLSDVAEVCSRLRRERNELRKTNDQSS